MGVLVIGLGITSITEHDFYWNRQQVTVVSQMVRRSRGNHELPSRFSVPSLPQTELVVRR